MRYFTLHFHYTHCEIHTICLMDLNYYYVWIIVAIIIFAFITGITLVHIYLRITCGVCKSERDLTGKVVIITGGNTGIGKEVVRGELCSHK